MLTGTSVRGLRESNIQLPLLLDKDGNIKPFYKKEFYEGNEQEFLSRLDQYYKGFYGTLFGSRFDESFVNEESKNLQYGYYLDILKFDRAKKYYQFKDSVKASSAFWILNDFIGFLVSLIKLVDISSIEDSWKPLKTPMDKFSL